MKVYQLIQILCRCDPNLEVTWSLEGFPVTRTSKINGVVNYSEGIALTDGSVKLTEKGSEEL